MMIDIYTKRILRENVWSMSALAVLLLSLMVTVWFFSNQFLSQKQALAQLTADLEDLTKKKNLMDYKKRVLADEIDLDRVNRALTQLIPLKEDYFSVVLALEKLSNLSGFSVTGYTIAVGSSTVNKLVIVVEGTGDQNKFLEFLKNYNFGGGRLITIDKIDFNQESYIGSKITLNLYSGKETSISPLTELTEDDRKLIQTILSKVEIQLRQEEGTYPPYPTKSKPF